MDVVDLASPRPVHQVPGTGLPDRQRGDGPGLQPASLLRHAAPGAAPLPDLARLVLTRLARRARSGTLVVHDGTGSVRLGRGSPTAEMTVHDRRAYAAVLGRGSVGLGRSYVSGWWSSPDLVEVVRVLYRWTEGPRSVLDRLGSYLSPVLDVPSRQGAPSRSDDLENIASHYNLSNQFFEVMLGPSMMYSCAVFDSPASSLDQAQEAKLARVCAKASLGPGDHVLEIGTGWGSFAIYAATRTGCRVTTTTISAEQRRYAEERVRAAGLDDRVTVLERDWRDLSGRFDKLVSLEMVEAVDWRLHDRFLAKLASLLEPDGLAVVQAIVIDDRSFERAKRHRDFVRHMVFPGGCIPSVASLSASVARATDLSLVDLEDIGAHYARTLRLWGANLEAAGRPRLQGLGADDRFMRLWQLYLAYCEASFSERHISDVQMVLTKPGWRADLRPRLV